MKLLEDIIEKIQEYSAALLSPNEIAVLVDIVPSEINLFCDICKNHQNSPIHVAYQKGRLTTKYELRSTVIKLAKAGSPAAEPLADKYLKEQLINE